MRILHSFILLLARLKVQPLTGPFEAVLAGTFDLQAFYSFRLPPPLYILRASKRANIHNYFSCLFLSAHYCARFAAPFSNASRFRLQPSHSVPPNELPVGILMADESAGNSSAAARFPPFAGGAHLPRTCAPLLPSYFRPETPSLGNGVP